MSGSAAWAQETIHLAFNPEPGTYVMVRDMADRWARTLPGQTAPQRRQSRTVVTMELHVGKADTDGHRPVKMMCRHVMQEINEDGRVSEKLDSNATDPSKMPTESIEFAMIGHPVTVTLDAAGRVINFHIDIQDFDAILYDYKVNTQAKLTAQEEKNLRNFVWQHIAEYLNPFQFLPGKPVAKGDSWKVPMPYSVTKFTYTCTLTDVTAGVATVTNRAATQNDPEHPNVDLAIDSTIRVDAATGMVKTASITQKGTSLAASGVKIVGDNTIEIAITQGAYNAAKTAVNNATPEKKKTPQREKPPGTIHLAFNPEPGFYTVTQESVRNTAIAINGHPPESVKVLAAVTVELSFGPANAAGKRNVKFVYRHARLEASSGGAVHKRYDSAKAKTASNTDPKYDALIGKVISATVDATGNLTDIKGLDDYIEAEMDDMREEGEMSDENLEDYERYLRQTILEEALGCLRVAPDKPVAQGDSWKTSIKFSVPFVRTLPLAQTCTLKDVQNGVATLAVNVTLPGDGKPRTLKTEQGSNRLEMLLTGTAIVDIATGLSTSETTVYNMKSDTQAANGNSMVVSVGGTIKRTLARGAYTPAKTAANQKDQPEKKTTLAFHPEPGTYVLTRTSTANTALVAPDGQTSKGRHRMTTTTEIHLGKLDASGHRELKLTFRRIQSEQQPPSGEVIAPYDSAAGKSREPGQGQVFDALIGKTFSVLVDSDGHLRNVQGFDTLLAAAVEANRHLGPGPMKEIVEATRNFAATALGQSEVYLRLLPDKPVARGDSWKNYLTLTLPMLAPMPFTQTSTFESVEDGVATVTGKGTLAHESRHPEKSGKETIVRVDMTHAGTTLVDTATGMTQTAAMTQKGTMTVSTLGAGDMKATFDNSIEVVIQKGPYTAAKTKAPKTTARK